MEWKCDIAACWITFFCCSNFSRVVWGNEMGELMMDDSHNRAINYQSAELSTCLMELINKIAQCHRDVSMSADGFWQLCWRFCHLTLCGKKLWVGEHLPWLFLGLLPVFSQAPAYLSQGKWCCWCPWRRTARRAPGSSYPMEEQPPPPPPSPSRTSAMASCGTGTRGLKWRATPSSSRYSLSFP